MTQIESIIILGGGIAGLSAAWKLKDHDVLLLEASSRAGGWIHSINKEGFLFETGPRSCRTYGNGVATLRLIRELGLESEILPASPEAAFRYIIHNKKLTKVPAGFIEWMQSPFLGMIIKSVYQDLTSQRVDQDCSIADFMKARLGDEALKNFVDPLVSGIYAGDPDALSVKACFPSIFELQRQYGSLCKGLLMKGLTSKKDEDSPSFPLFTLKSGLYSLVEALVQQLGEGRIKYHSHVQAVVRDGAGWKVSLSNGETHSCQRVISTLPAAAVEKLWGFKAPPASSVAVINFGYQDIQLPYNGFGYLVPSSEKESILGVVWDSKVFPGQQQKAKQARLTVMIGGMNAPKDWRSWDFVSVAMDAIKKHMGVSSTPDVINVSIADEAIPQYEVNYLSRLGTFIEKCKTDLPGLEFGGAFIDGVAINDCIYGADKYLYRK